MSVTRVMTDLYDVLRDVYFDPYFEQYEHFEGTTINRLLQPMTSNHKVSGDGITVQVETAMTDAAVASPVINSAFPSGGRFQPAKYRARFDDSDATTNDFWGMKTSARIGWVDLENMVTGGEHAIANAADRLFMQLQPDINRKMAVYNLCPKSGLLGLVDGDLKQGTNVAYSQATAWGSGDDEAVNFKVKDTALPRFQPGIKYDVYQSDGETGKVTIEVVLTDLDEKCVLAKIVSGDFGGTASAYDGGKIYYKDSKDKGMRGSVFEWMNPPASGDSFIGGVDRNSVGYAWMQPRFFGQGAAARTVDADIVRAAFDNMQLGSEEGMSVVVVGAPRLTTTVLNDLVDGGTVFDNPKNSVVRRFGAKTVGFQHPHVGQVTINSEPLMPEDRLYVFEVAKERGGWEMLNIGGAGAGLRFPPSGDSGNWYREESDDPGQGKSLIYRVDALIPGICPIMLRPHRNATILNLKPAA